MSNPNHDPHNGEFTFGSGDVAKAYQFYSPNEEENLTFEQASKNLSSENEQHFLEISKDVDRQVGLNATPHPAIGDWADGAENSVFNEIKGPASIDQVSYSAAIKGDIANQKAVISFVRDAKGPDTVYRMDLPGTLGDIRTNLDSAGLQFRTLVPTAAGAHVILYDQGSSLHESVTKLGEHYESLGQDIDVAAARGHGQFIGGDTREAGHDAYRKVISDYEKVHDTGRYQRLDSAPGDRSTAAQVKASGPSAQAIKTAFGSAMSDALASPDIQRSLTKLRRR